MAHKPGSNSINCVLRCSSSCLSGQIDVIYTDFAKAFDTVPHHRLLFKLKTYNINEDLIVWKNTWVEDCRLTVSINIRHLHAPHTSTHEQ